MALIVPKSLSGIDLNSQKLANLGNGTASSDAAAFGQLGVLAAVTPAGGTFAVTGAATVSTTLVATGKLTANGGARIAGTTTTPVAGMVLKTTNTSGDVDWASSGGNASAPFYATDYGLVVARRVTDGATTNAGTTVTSATAAFTGADVGRQLYIAGQHLNSQGFVSWIVSVTNGTTIVIANGADATATGAEMYIGDPQQTQVQAAIDAAAAAGGGTVQLPPGAIPITAKLILKNRVHLRGWGQRATLIWAGMRSSSVGMNDTMIQNLRGVSQAAGGNAEFVGVRDLMLDGGKARQTLSTTTTGAVAAGATSIPVTSLTNFPAASASQPAVALVTQGATREVVFYTGKSASTGAGNLTGVVKAREGTSDNSFTTGAVVAPVGHGIWLGMNPEFGTVSFQKPTNDDDFDAHAFLENLYIESVDGDGVQAFGLSSHTILGVQAYRSGKNGFGIAADTNIAGCVAGESDYEGFVCAYGNSVTFANCKAFYSGQAAAGSGWGFRLIGCNGVVVSACQAQDNVKSGYFFDGAQGCTVAGCIADSNNTGGFAGGGSFNGSAFSLYGAANNLIAGCASIQRSNGFSAPDTQVNAISIGGSSAGNTIILTHRGVEGGAVGQPLDTDVAGAVDGNNIQINGMGGISTVAWASTITPDPYAYSTALITLGGATTIANPTFAHKNQSLTFIFTQDATGGRVITWGNKFKTTWLPNTRAARIDTITLTFDGTNWQQSSAMPSLLKSQSAVAAGDTVTAAVITNFTNGSYTIPANMLVAGQALHLRALGVWGQGTTGNSFTPTLRRGAAGTTTLLAGATVALPASQTNAAWWLDVLMTVIATGASGTIETQGFMAFASGTAGVTTTIPITATAAQSIDTTVVNILSLAAKWSATTGTPTITMREFVVEALDQ